MATLIIGYLLLGTLVTTWFLHDCRRAKQRIQQGTGTESDQRAANSSNSPRIILFLLTLWPIAVLLYALAGDDTE